MNGKIDEAALPKPDVTKNTEAEEGLATETTKKVKEVWKEILGTSEIGLFDNFMEIGGNSILVIKMQEKLNDLFDNLVSVADIFGHPNVFSMTAFIDSKRGTDNSIVLLRQMPINEIALETESIRENTASFTNQDKLLSRVLELRNDNKEMLEAVLLSAYCVAIATVIDTTNGMEVYSVIGTEHAVFRVDQKTLNSFSALTDAVANKYVAGVCRETPKAVAEGPTDGILSVFTMNANEDSEFIDLANLCVRCLLREEVFCVECRSHVLSNDYLENILRRFYYILQLVFGINESQNDQ